MRKHYLYIITSEDYTRQVHGRLCFYRKQHFEYTDTINPYVLFYQNSKVSLSEFGISYDIAELKDIDKEIEAQYTKYGCVL